MRACTQAGRRTERGDERATGWNDGAASGGRNLGAMVAALSAADHDRAVLGRQFDRLSRGARSGAARGAGLLALGDRAGAAAAARLAAFAARLAGTAKPLADPAAARRAGHRDRKSTRLNSSH